MPAPPRAATSSSSTMRVWEDGFALKFYSYVRLSRALWPLLKDAQGSVVNIIGGASKTPTANFMIGGAVNAAITNFTKALAELGLRDGVAVKAVHPGMTVTGRLETLLEQRAAAEGMSRADVREAGARARRPAPLQPARGHREPGRVPRLAASPSRSTAPTCSSTAARPRRSFDGSPARAAPAPDRRPLARPARRGTPGRRSRSGPRRARRSSLSRRWAMPCSVTTMSASARGQLTTSLSPRRGTIREVLPPRGRRQRQDRAAAFGQARAAHEIEQAAGAAHLPAVQHLGVGLPVKIDRQHRVDRDEVVDLRDDADVVGVAARARTAGPGSARPTRRPARCRARRCRPWFRARATCAPRSARRPRAAPPPRR